MNYKLFFVMLSWLYAVSADQQNSSCKYSFKQLPDGGFRVVYEFDALSRDEQIQIAKNSYTAWQNLYITRTRSKHS